MYGRGLLNGDPFMKTLNTDLRAKQTWTQTLKVIKGPA